MTTSERMVWTLIVFGMLVVGACVGSLLYITVLNTKDPGWLIEACPVQRKVP